MYIIGSDLWNSLFQGNLLDESACTRCRCSRSLPVTWVSRVLSRSCLWCSLLSQCRSRNWKAISGSC